MSAAAEKAARGLLEIHDAYKEAVAREPECDDDGNPRNAGAWLDWHTNDFRPHAARLRRAVDNLALGLGEDVPRHPYGFRPLCEAIIAGGAHAA